MWVIAGYWHAPQAWVIPKGAKNAGAGCQWAKTLTTVDTWNKAAAARMRTVQQKGTFFTGLFTGNNRRRADQGQVPQTQWRRRFRRGDQQLLPEPRRGEGAEPVGAGSEIDAAWKSAVTKSLAGQVAPQAALDQAQNVYALIFVPTGTVVALALAMMLCRVGRAAGFFRTSFYLPVMTPAVAASAMFLLLLNGQRGLLGSVSRDRTGPRIRAG
ncbi:sugar ABC transporter permease [Kribbella qitaiheensis]|uniref:sugar ABC transporter permease n=1 Tax=Kribbella qitaiheensis TaxID=1544730 RepID=UPI001625031E|nr:sugar ABC transporter permease [Kribbella qitaiheensis]